MCPRNLDLAGTSDAAGKKCEAAAAKSKCPVKWHLEGKRERT